MHKKYDKHNDKSNGKNKGNNASKSKLLLNHFGLYVRDNLENLGLQIDNIHRKRNSSLTYRPFTPSTSEHDVLRQYLLDSANSIKRKRLHGISDVLKNDLLKSVVSEEAIAEIITTTTTYLLNHIALTAEIWSKQNILGERRFANLTEMTDSERHNLACDIANQNRALATLGGITAIVGLPAIIIDSLWLLMVSLRTVYQISHIYGHSITDKEGINIVYNIIGDCNLDNLKMKHKILIGSGMVSRVLKHTEHDGLQQALVTELATDKGVTEFIEHIEKILTNNNVNTKIFNIIPKIGKSLPILSTTVNTYYNSIIIDEVISIAQATFAPKIKTIVNVQ